VATKRKDTQWKRLYTYIHYLYHTCKYAYTYTYSPLSPSSLLNARRIKWCKRPCTCIELHRVSPSLQSYIINLYNYVIETVSLSLSTPAARNPVGEMPASMLDRHVSWRLACRVFWTRACAWLSSLIWSPGKKQLNLSTSRSSMSRSCFSTWLSSGARARLSTSGATMKASWRPRCKQRDEQTLTKTRGKL